MQRRLFFFGALAVPLAQRSNAQSSEDPIGTGMVGVGNRGSYLLRTVLQQPGVKVTALCDLKPDRLDKAATAAARDNPATMSDYRRMLDRKDVTAVYIA